MPTQPNDLGIADRASDELLGWMEAGVTKELKFPTSAEEDISQLVDKTLDLQLHTVRLPAQLVNDLKMIAEREGLKYQSLMRRVLIRFVECELRNYARAQMTAEANERSAASGKERKRA